MFITDSLISVMAFFGLPEFNAYIFDRYLLYLLFWPIGHPLIPVILYAMSYTPLWQYVVFFRNALIIKLAEFIISRLVKKTLHIKVQAIKIDYGIILQIAIVLALFICKNNMPNFYYSCIKRALCLLTGKQIKTFTPEQSRLYIINTIEMSLWDNLNDPQFYQAILNLKKKPSINFQTINVSWVISSYFDFAPAILFFAKHNNNLLLLGVTLFPDYYLLWSILGQIELPRFKTYKKKLDFIIIDDYRR